ncbi:hypothetical protein LAJLEIBI_03030 [[Clostridium] hylemonae DSM 15053]|nr:hypothetical protein LAJLEIBI_03030 [[Clostridium] hylemonae DSM 15053]
MREAECKPKAGSGGGSRRDRRRRFIYVCILYYYGAFAEKMEAEEFYANAVDFAVRASTIAVQRYGAIDSPPTLEEICEKGGDAK